MSQHYIYILDVGYDNLYKIGQSSNFNKSLKMLRRANPRLALYTRFPVKKRKWALQIEAVVHVQFERNRYPDPELTGIYSLDSYALEKVERFIWHAIQNTNSDVAMPPASD